MFGAPLLVGGLAISVAAVPGLAGCSAASPTGSAPAQASQRVDSIVASETAKVPSGGAAAKIPGNAEPTVVRATKKPATSKIDKKVAGLSDRRLAAQVIFGCTDSANARAQRNMASAGVGGIVLLGSRPPRSLKVQLRSVQDAAPKGHRVYIASDEEGGTVQRLAPLIYRLPSAETMGQWSNRKVRKTAKKYAKRMNSLGVDISLAPVADLRVPGSYLDRLNRAFSSNPKRVGKKVNAWASGTEKAGVTPVLKHWPGHGHAVDTHKYAARVPSLKKLRKADLIPFDKAMAGDSARAVMVAHVQSKGLTRAGQPATQSKRAIRILRQQAGPDRVIMTDSLSMAAASSARGLSHPQAVVKALAAGVDWAMVCTNSIRSTITQVLKAIKQGDLSRSALRDSAKRILEMDRR
ncbi:MAG: hypothetical protein K0U64_04790 [Actinomycetia bacterium]|nr:hypothetical protein [Actinomycetes bacterium]